jgi:tetratricopeptide (TPR) repeat protein
MYLKASFTISFFLLTLTKLFAWDPPIDSTKVQIDSLNRKLELLSKRNELFDNFYSSLEGLHAMYGYHLTWFSVILTVLAGFSIVFQFVATKRENDALRDLKNTFIESSHSQQGNNDRLIEKVGKNIEATTGFIEAYQSMIDMRSESENLKNAVGLLQKEEEIRKNKVIEEQRSINAKAIRLMNVVFASKFGSAYFNTREIKSFEEFYIQVNSHLPDLSKYPDIEKLCNGNVYFIMGLNNFLSNQTRDANRYLQLAKTRFDRLATSSISPEDEEIMYSEMPFDILSDRKNNWDKQSLSKTNFYLGVNQYKIGEFMYAKAYFEEAIKNLTSDIDSAFFLFQSKYWSKDFNSLAALIEEFYTVTNETINKNTEIDVTTLKMLNARLQTKIGDFCNHNESGGKFDIGKSKAIEYYKVAFQIIQEVNGTLSNIPKTLGQIVPMNYYGLANAIQGKSVNLNDQDYSPLDLYAEAEKASIWMVQSIDNQETQYILHYIIADCAFKRGAFREALQSIDLAIERFKGYYPSGNNKSYSPVRNLMLPKGELEDDLIEFRKKILHETNVNIGRKSP